jgi:hypothetical protein
MKDYRLELINNQMKLRAITDVLSQCPVIALDIETVDWWDRKREKIALIQFAFRTGNSIKIAVIDTLAGLDLEYLRAPLENKKIIKAIHNAAFDANKLSAFFKIQTAPIFDTMIAARRSGEKKYSLQAQSAIQLNIHLDKSVQRSDWSRRPLDIKQLDYAARDAFATFLLYEHQVKRSLTGHYQLKVSSDKSVQGALPLEESLLAPDIETVPLPEQSDLQKLKTPAADLSAKISAAGLAILGVIAKLPERYSPDQLAVSTGADNRVGITGWILDRTLGRESDVDESTVKLLIAQLNEHGLIEVMDGRRLQATAKGEQLWENMNIRY